MSSPTGSGPGGSGAALAPTDPPWVGRYRVRRRLGAGGMGLVYLAEAADSTPVAVKVIRPEYADDPVYRYRFRGEAEAAARVQHSGVARVLAADADGPSPYLVTEYVPGPSLRERVSRSGPLRGAELDAFAAGVARALAAIHAAGVVHRDLKPANVVLSPTGPRVVDFGIARAQDATTRYTSTGEIIGSIGWMAPEVLRQEPATAASDVFAWGAVVAFAGTGRRPFGEGTDVSVAHRVLAGPPPDIAGLPPHLVPLVTAALCPDPRARPPAAALASGGTRRPPASPGMWSGRTRVLPEPARTRVAPPVAAPPGTPLGPGRRRRRPAARVAVACVGGVVAVAALLGGLGRQPARSPSPAAHKPSGTAPHPSAARASHPGPSHAAATPRPSTPPVARRSGEGVLVAAVVPAVQDGDVVFRLTDLRCDLASVGRGANAQDEPDGIRACTALVTARNVGARPHFLLVQNLIGPDGRAYGSNGFLTPRLARPGLEAHTMRPGETLRSALVWELPAGVRPVAVELHGDVFSLGTRRALR